MSYGQPSTYDDATGLFDDLQPDPYAGSAAGLFDDLLSGPSDSVGMYDDLRAKPRPPLRQRPQAPDPGLLWMLFPWLYGADSSAKQPQTTGNKSFLPQSPLDALLNSRQTLPDFGASNLGSANRANSFLDQLLAPRVSIAPPPATADAGSRLGAQIGAQIGAKVGANLPQMVTLPSVSTNTNRSAQWALANGVDPKYLDPKNKGLYKADIGAQIAQQDAEDAERSRMWANAFSSSLQAGAAGGTPPALGYTPVYFSNADKEFDDARRHAAASVGDLLSPAINKIVDFSVDHSLGGAIGKQVLPPAVYAGAKNTIKGFANPVSFATHALYEPVETVENTADMVRTALPGWAPGAIKAKNDEDYWTNLFGTGALALGMAHGGIEAFKNLSDAQLAKKFVEERGFTPEAANQYVALVRQAIKAQDLANNGPLAGPVKSYFNQANVSKIARTANAIADYYRPRPSAEMPVRAQFDPTPMPESTLLEPSQVATLPDVLNAPRYISPIASGASPGSEGGSGPEGVIDTFRQTGALPAKADVDAANNVFDILKSDSYNPDGLNAKVDNGSQDGWTPTQFSIGDGEGNGLDPEMTPREKLLWTLSGLNGDVRLGFVTGDRGTPVPVEFNFGAIVPPRGGPGKNMQGVDPNPVLGEAWSNSTSQAAKSVHGLGHVTDFIVALCLSLDNVLGPAARPGIKAGIFHALESGAVPERVILDHLKQAVNSYNQLARGKRRPLPMPNSIGEFTNLLERMKAIPARGELAKHVWSADKGEATNPFGTSWMEAVQKLTDPVVADYPTLHTMNIFKVDPDRPVTFHPERDGFPFAVPGDNLAYANPMDPSDMANEEHILDALAHWKSRGFSKPSPAQIRHNIASQMLYGPGFDRKVLSITREKFEQFLRHMGHKLEQRGLDGKPKAWYRPSTRTIGAVPGNSDFTSLVHEAFHDYRRQMPEAHVQALEQAFGSRARKGFDEDVANAFEQFMREGIPPTKGMKARFESIKSAYSRADKRSGSKVHRKNLSKRACSIFREILCSGKTLPSNRA